MKRERDKVWKEAALVLNPLTKQKRAIWTMFSADPDLINFPCYNHETKQIYLNTVLLYTTIKNFSSMERVNYIYYAGYSHFYIKKVNKLISIGGLHTAAVKIKESI